MGMALTGMQPLHILRKRQEAVESRPKFEATHRIKVRECADESLVAPSPLWNGQAHRIDNHSGQVNMIDNRIVNLIRGGELIARLLLLTITFVRIM